MDALVRRMKALGETEPLMRALQLSAIAEAKALVPRKTGNLQRSILPGSVTATHAQVIANANYAGFVEHGTRPHEIRPKTKKALAWASGSGARLSGRPRKGAALTFAKVVHHPGTRAEAFMVPGAKRALEKAGLLDAVAKEWNSAA